MQAGRVKIFRKHLEPLLADAADWDWDAVGDRTEGDGLTPAHICAATGLTPARICAATGLTPARICAATGLTPAHICAGT